MKKDIIFSLSSPYRDDFRVTGYRFGKGEKSCCIIGSLRGNEIQQLYMCSQLVKTLEALERKGDIAYDREILIIPSINSYGTNIGKRFWCLDNTDINRMFPGDPDGETTERIAAGIFKEICKYQYGVQFASFYISGMFIPHVRMMKTCKENTSLANLFGLPYVVLRTPIAMDQSTLNFNWQVGGTAAVSVYTNATESIDEASAELGVSAVLRFLSRMGIIKYKCHGGYMGTIIDEDDMMNVTCGAAGIYRSLGIKNVKLTGGEPLVREHIEELIFRLKKECGMEKVTLTTNGILLEQQLDGLVKAGLDGVNISLDTLKPEHYNSLTGGCHVDRNPSDGNLEAVEYERRKNRQGSL